MYELQKSEELFGTFETLKPHKKKRIPSLSIFRGESRMGADNGRRSNIYVAKDLNEGSASVEYKDFKESFTGVDNKI